MAGLAIEHVVGEPRALHVDHAGREVGCNVRCYPAAGIHCLLLYGASWAAAVGKRVSTPHGWALLLAEEPATEVPPAANPELWGLEAWATTLQYEALPGA